jgi:uncharacterized protein (DUF2147 family)
MRFPFVALAVMVAASLLPQAAIACAAQPTAAGLWEQVDSTGRPDGWFLISKRGDTYKATLVKLFAKPGANLNPLCTKCPVDQKNLPWLGLTIIRGMQRQGLDYDSGIVLDPRSGSQYFARIRLSPDGQSLTVRGYLGIDPLGGGETWRRLPDADLNGVDPRVAAGLALASPR